MKELLVGKPMRITFRHPDIRRKIENFSSTHLTLDYDDMSENNLGHLYPPPLGAQEGLNTEVIRKEMPPLISTVQPNVPELLGFILATGKAGQEICQKSDCGPWTESRGH